MKLFSKKSGFTLIELLIVMVIITILATLGLVAYSQSLQNARNAKRISDLKSMQSAFEQYYTANGAYAAWTSMDTYLQGGTRPVAPSQGSAYVYDPATPSTTYCICAALEGGTVKGGNASNTSCPNPAWTTSGTGSAYCVQSRQ